MTMQGTQTQARVQTKSGQNASLDQVRSLRLPDGWHAIEDCEITYQAKGGGQKTVPFSSIAGFSDLDESANSSS